MNQNDVLQSANNTQNSSDDEIDLFELWDGLVQEKLTILASFLVIVIIAAVYAFSVTPVYKASTYLLPPQLEKVLPMNVLAKSLGESVTTNTTASVFKAFQANLGSRQGLKVVFDEYNLVEVYEPEINKLTGAENLKAQKKAFEQFVKDFSIQQVDKKDPSLGIMAQLSLALSDAQVAEILNDLVQKAEVNTVRKMAQQITTEKQARENLIKQKISSARRVEKDRRLDRIAELNEAILITQKLKLSKPMSSGPTMNINNINASKRDYASALYLLGSDLLEAEKMVLEQRVNDDAFIANLRGWQEELQQLSALQIEPKKFGVVNIDQPAIFADKVKPKKALILAVAGVLGIMLGVFIALIRRAVKKRKAGSIQAA